MYVRRKKDFSDEISDIETNMLELKNRQFTSQDSGMTFYSINESTTSGNIPETTSFLNRYVMQIFTKIIIDKNKPFISIPHMKISTTYNGNNYEKIISGQASQAISFEIGDKKLSIIPFKHMTNANSSNVAEWITEISSSGKHYPIYINIEFGAYASSSGSSSCSTKIIDDSREL